MVVAGKQGKLMLSKRSALRQRWLELRLLCRPGIGLAAIAQPVCRLAREIVGAEAASLFWLDRNDMPLGFFHEDSPAAARELFVNEFARLFIGPGEINVFFLAKRDGAPCGSLLAPPPDYFRSNTYNLLVRASGHHHCLDLRVDNDDGGRVVLLLFRGHHPAFTEQDAGKLALFDPLLKRAQAQVGLIDLCYEAATEPGHMLVDERGEKIVAICDIAEALLRGSNIVGQGVILNGAMQSAPRFVTDLCGRLMQAGSASTVVTIPAGRLRLEASPMRAPGADPDAPGQVLIKLHHETPSGIALIEPILEHRLSPLRSEILLYAASGGQRQKVTHAFAISKEAAKKHLREIYRAVGVGYWDDIPQALEDAAATCPNPTRPCV